MREYEFSMTCILPHKDKIYDFVSIWENTAQRKPYFRIFYAVGHYDLLDHGNLSFSKKLEKPSFFKFNYQLGTAMIENAKPTSKRKTGRPSIESTLDQL